MSKISLSPDANGTGIFTIASPNSNTNRTLTLPDNAGTIQTQLDNGFSFRNRIINGDMRIDQRNAGAAVTTDSAFPVDRFYVPFSTDGAYSAQQDSSAPAGFITSVKFTTTTADASLGATQYAYIRQPIEGTNVADLGWGTANAKTVTLSFWVRSSLTGTFGGALWNSAFNRSYPFTYSISVADTWEYKTVTIAGDTSGTWLTTNGIGVNVGFGLGVGSTYSGTAGAWAGAGYVSTTGAVSVIGTLNATWYITGVQLEVGSVATPFERRPYGTELALCQRYCQVFYQTVGADPLVNAYTESTTQARGVLTYSEMRAAPTITYSSQTGYSFVNGGTNGVATAMSAISINKTSFVVQLTSSGMTATQPGYIRSNTTNQSTTISAEL